MDTPHQKLEALYMKYRYSDDDEARIPLAALKQLCGEVESLEDDLEMAQEELHDLTCQINAFQMQTGVALDGRE